jgi:hypothetical protein
MRPTGLMRLERLTLRGKEGGLGEPRHAQRLRLGQGLSIAAIGAGVGWLVSQSASPVIAGVIASLLGIGAGVVTGLQSIRPSDRAGEPTAWTAIDARPAAVLVLAIAVAATAGLMVKAHRLLEPAVVREAAWRAAAEGRLKDLAAADVHGALLFKVSQSECTALLSLRGNDEAFVGELKASSLPGAQQLVARIRDPQTLVTVVEALCETR